jgi:hypothetical protein
MGQGQLGPVPGSPAVDAKGISGTNVLFDPLHQQALEGEPNTNTLGIYGTKGGPLAC